MRNFISVCGLVLLSIAVAQLGLASQDKQKPAEDSKKPADEPKEMTVVEHKSKTQGAVQVKSANKDPGDWFDVQQNGKRAYKGIERRLEGTVELPPGAYVAVVNKTQRKVNLEAGKKTILLTGDLMVQSKREGTFWVPKQGKDTRLASNPPIVNRSVALFPGKYDVYINVGPGNDLRSLGAAEVKAGKTTVVKE